MSAPVQRPGERTARVERIVELLPVLSALALHAVAHGRWLLAAPLGVALAAVAIARVSIAHSSLRLIAAGALGAGAGVLLLFVAEPPPDSPIPPQVLSPLCGALAGLAALCFLSRHRVYAWIYASLLAVLSLDVPATWPLLIALGAMVASVLAVAFMQGGLVQTGWRGALGFTVFVGMMAVLGLGLMNAIRASEGMLVNAVYQLMKDPEVEPGLGLRSELGLPIRSRMRGGKRTLFELSGERPERLRTVVFDQFDGVRWRTSAALAGTVLDLAKLPPPAATHTMEMLVLTPLGTMLPAPAGTRAVEGTNPEVRGGWVLHAPKLEGTLLTFHADAAERLPPEPAPDATLTALPEELKAELEPFAADLTRGARTPRQMAEALAEHFREEYVYSLDVDLQGKGSPLAVLIREKRPAYCTYFASAMAALLRVRGVPARVVGGFAPLEQNPLNHATVVRERDAHAWLEVYLADEGRFVAFDPTPWRSRDGALGLEDEKPGLLGNLLGAGLSLLRRALAIFRSDPSGFLWSMVKSPFFFVPLVALAAWRLLGARQQRRAKGPREAMRGADPATRAAYARYLRALERRAGLVPAPAETDDELLARLRAARGDAAAQAAEDFLGLYRQVRYRGVPAGEPLEALVAKVDAALRRPEGR